MILLKNRRCKICKFFETGNGQYRTTEIKIFEHKIREGVSLRELAKYLSYSCRVELSHNCIRSHIDNCVSEDIRSQRQANINIRKPKKNLKQRVKRFFSKQSENPKTNCKHTHTESWFQDGLVWTKCNQCNKVLGKHDPDQKSRNSKEKNWVMLEALMGET